MDTDNNECCIHICNDDSVEVLKCMTVKNHAKIKSCIPTWISLDGVEKDVATKLSLSTEFNRTECCVNDWFLHQKCYINFTNQTNIERRKKRLRCDLSTDRDTEPRCSKRKRTRTNENKSRLFPNTCVICKQNKYFLEKHSGKKGKKSLCSAKLSLLVPPFSAVPKTKRTLI